VKWKSKPICTLVVDEENNIKLGTVVVKKEGSITSVMVKGRKLVDMVIDGDTVLGDVDVGTKEKPMKFREIKIEFKPLGWSLIHRLLPLYKAFVRPGTSFKSLKAKDPRKFAFYLVTRLGTDLSTAARMVDGSMYAEKYLSSRWYKWINGEVSPPGIYIDEKFRFAPDQVLHLMNCIAVVREGRASGEDFVMKDWNFVVDNHLSEIGVYNRKTRTLHKPTVEARISRIDEGKRILYLEFKKIRKVKLPLSYFFDTGNIITNRRGIKAKIESINLKDNAIGVESTEGFKKGDIIRYIWEKNFPIHDAFFFYGAYGLGRYEDVFLFPPGAIGIHVDSCCMNWARKSLQRGISATFGVVIEPFSCGIPYGDIVLRSLMNGNDMAEAMASSIYMAQRWAGVVFCDPLYAPFRYPPAIDATKPVIGRIEIKAEKRDKLRIEVFLGGKTEEELVDVAVFKLQYGTTREYQWSVPFYRWSVLPEGGGNGRRNRILDVMYSGYSRRKTWIIKKPAGKGTYFFRITARDPAGNETHEEKTYRVAR